ncbi:MAG: hypothetical protein QXJ40_00685 [Candidatus Bathyarchaeia archaeon]
MSVNPPVVAIAFGNMAPPQGDVIELRVHLGCTSEVSSFEMLLQNWGGKYSPNGATPISVGMDGNISVGRGAACPLLMTCRVESIKYEATPPESYVRVGGRCWGERLFRRVVTKTYENMKGEDIVKDLLDYYVGLSHVRGGTELVEATDTTYTKLEYESTPVWDILRYIAETADKQGIIGYDFRVAPDAKFEFFPRGSKTSPISLSEKIEQCEYRRDIHRVRNKVTVYGATDKSAPADKDAWTESLTPSDGYWVATAGSISLDANVRLKGFASVKLYAENLYYGAAAFILYAGREVNANLYPLLNLWLRCEAAYNGQGILQLLDRTGRLAQRPFTIGKDEWFKIEYKVGEKNADGRNVESGFDWNYVWQVRPAVFFDGVGTGGFWIDGLCFGGCRYSSTQEASTSQSSYGLREQVEVNEGLWSDAECALRAKALLANLKDSAEQLTLRSTVIDYGASPLLPGDKVHITLPNEGVDGGFRILSVEYNVDAKTQTLETVLELGREKPLLADYLFRLQSRTDSLSRYKLARS